MEKPVSDLKNPWTAYLGGKWVKTAPTVAGLYACATRQGVFVGYRLWILRAGKVVDERAAVNEPGWQGWTWSRPVPLPPTLPGPWDEETEHAPASVRPPELTPEASRAMAEGLVDLLLDETESCGSE